MNCITSQENTFVLGEVGADSLPDLIGGPPVAVLVGKLVRR